MLMNFIRTLLKSSCRVYIMRKAEIFLHQNKRVLSFHPSVNIFFLCVKLFWKLPRISSRKSSYSLGYLGLNASSQKAIFVTVQRNY